MDVNIQVDVSKNLTDPTSCTSQTVDLTKGANKTNDIKQSYFVVYRYCGRKYVTKLRCHIPPQEVGYFRRKEKWRGTVITFYTLNILSTGKYR